MYKLATEKYLTVSALTKYLKRKFDADPYLGRVYLTGEISNFRMRPNAHQYFSLKDERAKISAIMFRSSFEKVKFRPEEGMKVLVVGRISLYEATGNYQIYVEKMEPDGVGALYQAYEQLKKKLAAEGLFSAPKQKLPAFPQRIAVITSRSGAVIKDIMTTVRRRYPIVQLVLFPALVQGESAAADIVEKIHTVERLNNFDTLIIGRGGGSIEDLWPFNEEMVARAIYDCDIPVISSVGHETDTTIADLVADVRAATPTAAAELAVPVLSDELLKINQVKMRLYQAFKAELKIKEQQLLKLRSSYVFQQPERLYEGYMQKLDYFDKRAGQAAQAIVSVHERRFARVLSRLREAAPIESVRLNEKKIEYLQERLRKAGTTFLEQKEQRVKAAIVSLDMLSPLKIMTRGYSYVSHEKHVIKSVKHLTKKQQIEIHFADGNATAEIKEIKEDQDND